MRKQDYKQFIGIFYTKRIINQSFGSEMGRSVLIEDFQEISEIESQLDVTEDVKNEIYSLFQKAEELNLLRGRSAKNILGGAVYAACRRKNCPRTFSEIARVLDVEKKRVYRGYKHLVRNLKINVPPAEPEDCLSYLTRKLELNEKTDCEACRIIEKAEECGISSGRCPFGLAAAAIYIAGHLVNKKKSQKEIKEAATVSEVTLRNRIKEIVRELDMDIDVIKN